MLPKRLVAATVVIAGLVFISLPTAAQTEEKFKARLSIVPIDVTMRANVTGKGSIAAVLTGRKLSITGAFEGLQGAATLASLHQALATGVRGSAFRDLTVSKATAGTIAGSFELTPEQVESLKKGKLYVQIHSEKAPDGNLWGWLLR